MGAKYYGRQSQGRQSQGDEGMLNLLAEAALEKDQRDGMLTIEEDWIKPKRKRASPWQISVLQRAYLTNPFPSSAERRFLAERLHMSPRAVQIWFQNRRQSVKRENTF